MQPQIHPKYLFNNLPLEIFKKNISINEWQIIRKLKISIIGIVSFDFFFCFFFH